MRKLFLWLPLLAAFWLVAGSAAQDGVFEDVTGIQYRLEEYTAANFPVGMVFAPDGRLFYNEKITGSLRVVSADGVLQPDPIITLPTNALSERGMLGLALSPTFEDDQLLYLVHTLEGTAQDYPTNRLVRFTVDENNQPGEVEELLSLPIETGLLLHNGGNVHFDEQGYLYITFGDYGDPAFAQDLTTMQGAIHRFEVTDSGLQPAPGNPFGAESSIYAYGLRNLFDFTFDPYSDTIFGTENGPSCDDEINVVLPGRNYGWDVDYQCMGLENLTDFPDYQRPLLSYTPTIAPTGIVVYDGEAFPQWQGNLFFCDWNRGILHRVVLDDTRTQALGVFNIELGDTQCRLDLVIGPDNGLYFGTVGDGGGSIMRILPVEIAGQ